MKPIIGSFVFGACLGLYTPPVSAEESEVPVFVVENLDKYVEDAIAKWQIPGVAISIVHGGKPVLVKGYGTRKLGDPERIDEHTLFAIGSTTKAFTAIAIANLVDLRGSSLDEPIKNMLPDFNLSDAQLTEKLSVQDLLSHRSGLATYQGDFIFYDSDLTKSQMFNTIGKLKLPNENRTFGYTNIGYFIIGEAIASLSGQSYEDYLQQTFFDPLGMNDTVVGPAKLAVVQNRAHAYTTKDGKAVARQIGDASKMVAAGGISTSAHDISNWMLMQLGDGRFEEKQLVPPEVIAATRKPQILVGKSQPPYTIFGKSNFETYSSGWYNIDYEGREIVTHNGGTYGFTSSVTLVPEIDLGIAILTNSDSHMLIETLKLEIIDAFLGLPFRNYDAIAQRIFGAQAESKQASLDAIYERIRTAPKPAFAMAEYQGVYWNDAYGEIEITGSEKSLKMKFQHHPELTAELKLIEDFEFLSTFNKPIYGNTVIPFKSEDGRITSLEFSVDGNVEPNSYIFLKRN